MAAAKKTSSNGNGHRNPSLHQPQRLLNFNSARTAGVLSLLLLLTLVIQVILIAYHDEFVLELNSLEDELLQDIAAANSVASDAFNANAALEYKDGLSDSESDPSIAIVNDGFGSRKNVIKKREMKVDVASIGKIAKYFNLSMEPMDILARAGVDHTAGFVPSMSVRDSRAAQKSGQKIDQRQQAQLPPLDDIQSMYGNRPHIIGLERCEEFRETVLPENRIIGPAGIFNSATNLLKRLLVLNCANEARMQKQKTARKERKIVKIPNGMHIQAPWGKHNPVTWRLHHEAAVGGEGFTQADFLPIVMIKDPITWMASMCRHPYEARWRHTNLHCPNLVPNKHDRGRQPGVGAMGISVKFATQHIGDEPIPDRKNKTFVNYTSLVDLWNTWYKDWHGASFPRLMVRFEDLMFHAEETVSQVCACGGGTMKQKFRYVEESAKGQGGPHAGSAGFLASLVTYGNRTLRMEGILTEENDAEYARQHLSKELMDMFGYAPI